MNCVDTTLQEFKIFKSSGEEVLRPDAITREHVPRSKDMTYSHQVDLSLKNIEANIISKMRSKLESANEDHEKLVENDRNVVKKLSNLAEPGLPVAESSLVHCKLERTLQIKLSSRLISIDFILAHDDGVKRKRKKDDPSAIGKGKKARRCNKWQKCRILHAFDCRMKPNRIEGSSPMICKHSMRRRAEGSSSKARHKTSVLSLFGINQKWRQHSHY